MENQVVVITGADSGIGLAVTRELLSSGNYLVGALDLNDSRLGEMRDSYPEVLSIHLGDITDSAFVARAVDSLVARWGHVDILVNNACLAIFGRFEEKELSDTRREFEVNFFGTLNMIKAVVPHMKESGRGVIHNVSSGVGITGFPGIYGYASSKGAVETLTRTLALELAPLGIIVNLVHPPLTRTNSSVPLGIPLEVMDDPGRVGRRLAGKIGSTRALITPDLKTLAGLFLSRHFPERMGRLMARLTDQARKEKVNH